MRYQLDGLRADGADFGRRQARRLVDGAPPGRVLTHKILIADSYTLYRETIAAFLAQQMDFEVFQAASPGAVKRAMARGGPFDLVIFRQDPKKPIQAQVKQLNTLLGENVRLAFIGGRLAAGHLDDALAAGAVGHIPVSLPSDQLSHVIRLMIAGGIYTPAAPDSEAEPKAPAAGLKQRDYLVLRWLADGATNKEIAAQLNLQEVTVKVIVGRLLRRFEARNRAHLVGVARSRQLI